MSRTQKNVLLLILLITIIIGFLPIGKFNLLVQLIFTSIGIISVLGIFLSNNNGKGYSLNIVYWLFNYTFFFIAPLTQFKYATVFYTKNIIKDALYINAGLTILIASIIYLFFYRLVFYRLKNVFEQKRNIVSFPFLLYLSIISFLVFFYLIKFNFQVLLFRPPSGWLKLNTFHGSLGYALVSVIRFVPFFCLMLYLLSANKKRKFLLLLLSLTIITTFPLSLSRGILAGLYLPLLVLLFPVLKKKYYFLSLFLISIVFIFPLVNSFRDVNTNGFIFSYELFNSSQLDAFQNFMLLLHEQIVTNGSQLVDAIFFLNENRKGSGQVLGEQVGYNFYNVAMPFIGEGFINFSYFGIIVFTIFIASFNAFLDKKYESFSSFLKAIYLILLGFEFYILRGDLSSSIKKMTGFILALLIIASSHYIYRKLYKTKNS